MNFTPMSQKTSNKIVTTFGVLVLVATFFLIIQYSDQITKLLIQSGPWAPIVALILYPLLAITPVSADPITLILVVTYGPVIGATIAFFGGTTAAMFEYYFGLTITKTANLEKLKAKMPFGLGKMPVNSILFLVFGRMIPGYGSKVISFLAAFYKVPPKRYFWTTVVTNIFGSILMAYGGLGLIKLLKF